MTRAGPYSARHLCVLVPTKDRPERVRTLLTSLVDQREPVGRVIIVASGSDIRSVIDEFAGRLHIDYVHSSESGQIRQRNLGIGLLDDRTPLVACLDDDILVEPGAVDQMIAFWNGAPADTGGVGFNIVNGTPERATRLKVWLGTSHPNAGRVLRSGMTTSLSHLSASTDTQWLNGGTSVWRADILKSHRHAEVDCPWAYAEDLIFSYPIGKRFPTFVCAGATVQHLELKTDRRASTYYVDKGRTEAIWLYYFVSSHRELSIPRLLWALTLRVTANVAAGLRERRSDRLWFSLGILEALGVIAGHALGQYGEIDIRLLTTR